DPAEGLLWKAIDEGELDAVAKVLRISDGRRAASLGPVVDALREWRKDLGDRSQVNKLRYRIGWQTVVPKVFPPMRQRWLVLVFVGQVDNDAWVAGLSGRYNGDIDVLAIDPSDVDRNSLSVLLSEATAGSRCDGVVSFMALHEGTHPDFPGVSMG